jgi:hypothetical protein
MESTAADPRTVALAYLEAVGQKQFDRVAALLHPDLEFKLGNNASGKDEYIAALRRLGPILLRNEIRQTVADGNEICVLYDFLTDTAVGPVPTVEWLTIEGQQVRSVRLMFERERWPEVLAELARRATAVA